MPEWVISALASTVVSTALVGLVIRLTGDTLIERLKSAVKHEYDEKLESHKAKLRVEADLAQEKLRSQLQIAAAHANTTFARLHERRFDAIEQIYGKLRIVYFAVEAYGTGSARDEVERQAAVLDAIKQFNDAYLPKQVLLSESLEKAVAPIEKNLRVLASNIQFARLTNNELGQKQYRDALSELTDGLPDVFADLRRQMRVELGDALQPEA